MSEGAETARRARLARQSQAAQVQRRAADPAASLWVAASAGTGKTKVLTDRVLSLLLSGTPPHRLLCLTFTKAAAAEMNRRLADTLMRWASGPDARLAEDIADLLGGRPAAEALQRARQLFAAMLDVPGGMKIQTIHAFCQSLLGRFPIEAAVPPHFDLLDELSAAERLRSAQETVLARAGSGGEPELAGALDIVTGQVGEVSFADILSALIGERGRLLRLRAFFGEGPGFRDALARRLGIDPAASVEAVLAAAAAEDAFDAAGLARAARALLQGNQTDRTSGAVLAHWLESRENRPARWEAYLEVFFTKAGERRKKLAGKAACAAFPEIESVLAAEAERLAAVRETLQAVSLLDATEALVRLATAIIETYQADKLAHGLLDYEDLILKARDLLRREGISPWVLYKLDGGLDHLLIDEAQDTNPDQWEVVRLLTEEFFSGEGAHEDAHPAAPRTVFAVGDAKQSIYSFQRADPAAFAAMRRHFAERARAARRGWANLALTLSFRSTGAVLRAVDAVFASQAARDGLTFGEAWLDHAPVRVGQAGRVELWPPAPAPAAPDMEAWAPPLERADAASARSRLARLIAARIERWTRAGEAAPGDEAWLDSQARPVQPGDILVLVRRRGAFVEELVRELKNRAVPVAGVDRMVLVEQLAVMDLVALGRAMLLPEDDLTLASVLKSPLVGLDEEQLFALAYDRGPRSLWARLREAGARDPAFRAAYDGLAGLAARADYTPPFEFFADLLAQGGRRRLLARLGPEAADPIEEFLSLALTYEREQTPSLEGFLHWLEAGRQEVKRDLEAGGTAVRVMTVHGAKGLQAPIVFLPDTLQMPKAGTPLFWLPRRGDEPAELPLWSPRTALDEGVAGRARAERQARQEQEYRRLLYVAMTRAEDRLYVCGWHNRQAPPEGCWYEMVARAFAEGGAEAVDFDFTPELAGEGWSGPGWRLADAQVAEVEARAGRAAPPPPDAALPDWATLPAPAEESPPRPLAPSRPSLAEPAVRSPLAEDFGRRFRRGRLVHRLLQTLPDLPAAERPAAARRFLASPAHALPAPAQAALAEEVLAVLADPAFAPLFGPGSRAEVPVVGLVEGRRGPQVVSGQIDRIFVDSAQVIVLDFKTNRPAPRRAAEVPAVYLAQMAAYRAVLQEIYADRPVTCALLWTDGPRLLRLDAALLDAHAP